MALDRFAPRCCKSEHARDSGWKVRQASSWSSCCVAWRGATVSHSARAQIQCVEMETEALIVSVLALLVSVLAGWAI